jgi:peroxiredoxin
MLVPAPDVIFTSITGKKIALKNLRGKIVIINFWATDCKSCLEEVPQLIKLYDHYHSQGLEIISVSMYYDLPNHVVAMSKNKKIPYDLVLDLRAEHAKAFGNVQLIPTTFLINHQGQISSKKTGLFDIMVMEKYIQTLISKMPVI